MVQFGEFIPIDFLGSLMRAILELPSILKSVKKGKSILKTFI